MEFQCKNCVFWKKNNHTDFTVQGQEIYKGECHCYPPQRIGHLTEFPMTEEFNWCGRHLFGEYKNKEK